MLAPADLDAVIAVGNDLLHVLRAPFAVAEHTLDISASIGVLVRGVDGADPEGLLDAVDGALYHAKAGGGGVVYLCDA